MSTGSLTEIRTLLDRANTAYYLEGRPLMEDARYDRLKEDLARLDPTDPRLAAVGASVRDSLLQKRPHAIPMGSQSKVTTRQEFDSWVENTLCKPLDRRPQELRLHASYKMDGGSLSIEYRGGRPIVALSRGDGTVGEDITANVLRFHGLPMYCALDGQPFTGFVRCEMLLPTAEWDEVDPDKLSNPRNCAVGIARRKNGSQSDLLHLYAFRIFTSDGRPLGSTETQQSQLLTHLGFTPTPYCVGDPVTVWSWFCEVEQHRSTLPWWIDGIVLKLDDLATQLSLGETNSRPKGQVALKFAAESAETTLLSVTLQLGYTGAIIPVGAFTPVQIGGTTVRSATLSNWEVIETLGLAIGDRVALAKAGDIIPKVIEVVAPGSPRTPIPEPGQCPVCAGPVGRRQNVSGEDSTILYCLSPGCPAKVTGRLTRYLSSLDILAVGDELIHSLVTDLGVTNAADLYTLHQRKTALAALVLGGKVRLGEKRATKFLAEIEKRRHLSLSDFLGSLGIFGLGKRRVALVQHALPGQFDTLEDWLSGKLVQMAAEAGLPNTADRISRELLEQAPLIEKFLANGVTLTRPPSTPAARSGAFMICITGALSQPKSHYQRLIEAAGYAFTDTYSPKAVTHLIAADPTGSSSKLARARKAGTPILSEADLLALLTR